MFSYLIRFKSDNGDDVMLDLILFASVFLYMILGYFFVAKAEKFFYKNFKGNNESGEKPHSIKK